jgi:hypothetical protein
VVEEDFVIPICYTDCLDLPENYFLCFVLVLTTDPSPSGEGEVLLQKDCIRFSSPLEKMPKADEEEKPACRRGRDLG